MPAQKGREGKQTVPNAVPPPRIPVWEWSRNHCQQKRNRLFFLPQWVLHSRAGSELSLEDNNCDISAFILYYELDYQIRSLGNTGYNDMLMKVDVTDDF